MSGVQKNTPLGGGIKGRLLIVDLQMVDHEECCRNMMIICVLFNYGTPVHFVDEACQLISNFS